ncbi:MAG: hypothetical protein VX460_09770 [Planctomycetota bacterium]|nr:hypothetical protein [Planctomycetota bacterium]
MIGSLALAGPPVQGGPDSPLGDLLGYFVIFVVVVWPIIRGVLDQAKGRRAQFEQQQRRNRPTGARARAGGGRSLEEILRGDPYVEALEEPLLEEVVREIEAPSPPPLPRERPSEPSFGERPADELRPSERELVGDPFDDSIMGGDLVQSLALAEVPTEDELEVAIDPGRREQISEMAEQSASLSTPRAAERGLGGLERRFTPWQRAFVLKEILGAPAATRAFDDGRL